jgi:hypothetical protein
MDEAVEVAAVKEMLMADEAWLAQQLEVRDAAVELAEVAAGAQHTSRLLPTVFCGPAELHSTIASSVFYTEVLAEWHSSAIVQSP